KREGVDPLLCAGRYPSARYRDHSGPGRDRRPHRASLRPAGDAAVWSPGDSEGLAGLLQYTRRDRYAGKRHPAGAGGDGLMSDLRELYQEVILDHNKRPRNFHKLQEANRTAEGHNPLCGDNVTVYLKLENGVIQDISFEGSGCAISKASAS